MTIITLDHPQSKKDSNGNHGKNVSYEIKNQQKNNDKTKTNSAEYANDSTKYKNRESPYFISIKFAFVARCCTAAIANIDRAPNYSQDQQTCCKS